MPEKILSAHAFRDVAEMYSGLIPDGYELHYAPDAISALDFVYNQNPRFVITDALLPAADGYSLARMIRRLDVPVIPGIIVASFRGMLRKTALPGVVALPKPIDKAALLAAFEKVEPHNRRPDEPMTACIDDWLEKLGVPQHAGRDYLAEAVFMAHEDMTLLNAFTTRLYPLLADIFGVKSEAVERAMRHAVDIAWSSGSIESQYLIFKNTIDAARGKPTCGGMIAQLAYMLRMEVF